MTASPTVPPNPGQLGVVRGTAMYVASVLGPGALAFPALAAAAAGPASLLVWLGLFALSVPVAASFAVLSVRYPDGGGVAEFVRRAFGAPAAAAVGWCLLAAVPAGVAAGAVVGGRYVAAALGGGPRTAIAVTVLILAATFAANHAGLRLSGQLQVVLVTLMAVLLGVTILSTAGQVNASNFTPFAPGGATALGHAAAVVFGAFTGWEAASSLAADFTRPRRQLPVVTAAALTVVGLLYVGLAVVTVGVLGAAATSDVALTLLLRQGIGQPAALLTGVAAFVLTLGTLNTLVAGAGRLSTALARDGALPRALAGTDRAGVPHRSVALQGGAAVLITAGTLTVGSLAVLLHLFSVLLTAVTAAGLLAAVRLLPAGPLRHAANITAAVTVAVLLCNDPILLALPAGLAAAAVLHAKHSRRHPHAPASRVDGSSLAAQPTPVDQRPRRLALAAAVPTSPAFRPTDQESAR